MKLVSFWMIIHTFKQLVFGFFSQQDDGTAREEKMGDNKMEKMCINTEWGGLGDDGSLNDIITPYDTEVDQNSINTGKQRLDRNMHCHTCT